MAIKDLLVAYNDDPGAQNALKFALQMGTKYGASVTGVYAYAPETYEGSIRRWIASDVLESVREAEQHGAREIEKSFRARVAEAGHQGPVDFFIIAGQPDLMLARTARFYDLLLTGQFVGSIAKERRAMQPEQLLLRSGKPLIIVPADYGVRPFKEHAAIAWDGSRSAARALTDAMQILETKTRLDVLSVETGPDEDRHPDMPDRDVLVHLGRHGIKGQVVRLEAERHRTGQALLAYCQEADPDILVMGAFGRAKLGATVFGGVTRHVLEHMTVPLLMSH